MARGRKKRGRKKPRRLDPEAVLQGQAEVDLREMLELIRRVNPTDRNLRPAEQQRRYGIKSSLQSLLIQRFGDELVAEPDSPSGEIVMLRVRQSGNPAGHARVEDLEQEPRLWVRRQLDQHQLQQQGPDADAPGATAQGSFADSAPGAVELAGGAALEELDPLLDDEQLRGMATGDLLQRGQTALEQYDYDEARRFLWQACRRSRGAPGAALPLAEMLVNHLAAYGEALQMLSLLSSAAASDPQLRQLLGMAAARVGDVDRARQLVRGMEGEGVVEVYTVLASAALEREDDAQAAALLAGARQHGPKSHETLRLEQQLAQLCARKWKPTEQRIEAAMADGDAVQAAQLAEELLERWPHSTVARKLLGELERRRRDGQRERLLGEAEQATEREEFTTAAAALRQALELGGDRPKIEQLLQHCEQQAQQQTQRAQVQRVLGALEGDDHAAALLAYLDLEPRLRRRIRDQQPRTQLGWLEQMSAPRAGARARAAVEAVLALQQAGEAMDAGDPARARALLAPHGKALEAVEQAARLQQRADQQLEQASQDAALASLEQARQVHAAGDLGAARELLEGLPRIALPQQKAAEAEQLLAAVLDQELTQQLSGRFEDSLASGDLIGARQAAAAQAQRGGDRQRHWMDQQQQLTGRIREQWRVQIFDDAEEYADLRDFKVWGIHESPQPWLVPGGRELMLVDCHDSWIFIRQVELASRRTVRLVMLRSPRPMGAVSAVTVDRGTLWITGTRDWLLQLDCRDWDVLCWHHFGDLAKRGEKIDRAFVMAPGRYLWFIGSRDGTKWRTRVVDLERWRIHRRLPEYFALYPVYGGPEPLVVGGGFDKRTTVYTARGTPETRYRTSPEIMTCGAAVHPGGDGLLLHHPHLSEEYDEDEAVPLALSSLLPGVGTTRLMIVENSDHERLHDLATGLEQGVSFATHLSGKTAKQLLALQTSGAEVRQLFSLSIPVRSCMVQDTEAWQVAALLPGDEDVQLLHLESQIPEPAPQVVTEDAVLPRFAPPFYCSEEIGSDRARAYELLARLREMVKGQVEAWAREYARAHGDDVGALVDLRYALNTTDHAELAAEISRWTWERFPRDSRVALSHAEALAEAQRWEEARQVLEALPDADMDRPRPQHFYHLLGVLQYRCGDEPRARRSWELGARIRGKRCELDHYITLVNPMDDPPAAADWAPGLPLIRQLRGAILVADACLAQGNAAGAVAALSRQIFFRIGEIQSQARLAEAQLLREPSRPAELFHKALALAAFCDLSRNRRFMREELPLAGHCWDAGHLEQVRRRAEAWLERLSNE